MQAIAFQDWFAGLAMALAAGLFAWTGIAAIAWLRSCASRQQDLPGSIDRLLPQTQCGQCGYPGCRPYADAIARGDAINKCPPGGPETIATLARLLDQPPIELDPAHGAHVAPRVAIIREADCIGCTKCIQVCPVDAIVGAPKLMHTVVAADCTGCELCIAPCPVDCIDLLPSDKPTGGRWRLAESYQPPSGVVPAQGAMR